MKLAETILDNERNQREAENNKLVRTRLKELVYSFPKETLEILHQTGVPVGVALPSPILYAVVVKHLATNSQLREAVARMLIEADGYSSADGAVWQMVGGALSAVGSVLGGIGRGQKEQSDTDSEKQAQLAQQQLELERAKRTRQTWMWVGIGLVVVIAIIIGIRAYMKSKAAPTVKTGDAVSKSGEAVIKTAQPQISRI
ncbi:hypothetical protein D3C71_563860 [compost metagenome]